MKLVTYRENGAEKVGALTKDGAAIVPLSVPDMNTLIETMPLSALSSAVTAAEDSAGARYGLKPSSRTRRFAVRVFSVRLAESAAS